MGLNVLGYHPTFYNAVILPVDSRDLPASLRGASSVLLATTGGLSLVAHAGKVLLKIVANRLGDFCEEAGIFSEEQCGFRPQRSTTNIMFVVRRLQELGRTSNTSLEICFIDLAKAYDSVDRVLLWKVLARFGVPLRMIKVVRMFTMV